MGTHLKVLGESFQDYEYQHDRVEMFFKNIYVVLWMKVASALEGLRGYYLIHIFFFPAQVGIAIYDSKIHIKVVFEESISVHQQSSDHLEVTFECLTNLHLTVQICDSWITTKTKLKLLHLLVAPKI